MSNHLDNGSVLPHGLLGDNQNLLDGFNKTYNNTSLKVGVIVKTYPINDPDNRTGFAPEYDVIAVEQNEDRGVANILYRHCLSATALGSLADFFDMAFRQRETKENKGQATRISGHDGSVVLFMCLDKSSDKGIIIGAFPHPDRPSTIPSEAPYLEGEYNGVNIMIEEQGNPTLTFNGATDNQGEVLDDSQGPTEVKIEEDGSMQFMHDGVTLRLDKSGTADLTAEDDITNTTKTNFVVAAQSGIKMEASAGNLAAKAIGLALEASGSATLKGLSISAEAQTNMELKGLQVSIEASVMAKIKGTLIVADGLVFLGGQGGAPVLTLTTMFMGIGNLGAPVISNAIAGFATKAFAQ